MDEASKRRYQQAASTYLLDAFGEQANEVTLGILWGIQLHESDPEEAKRFLSTMIEKEHDSLRASCEHFIAHMREELQK